MGSREAYAVLVMARCGRLDDSRRLIEAQKVTGLSIAHLREGKATGSTEAVYSDHVGQTAQHGARRSAA